MIVYNINTGVPVCVYNFMKLNLFLLNKKRFNLIKLLSINYADLGQTPCSLSSKLVLHCCPINATLFADNYLVNTIAASLEVIKC